MNEIPVMMTPIRALCLAMMALDDVASRCDDVLEWGQAKAWIRQMLEQERQQSKKLDLGEYRVLAFINGYIDEHGYSPTYAEICQHFGWRSKNTARYYLSGLQDKGRVTWEKGRTRSVRVLRDVLEA